MTAAHAAGGKAPRGPTQWVLSARGPPASQPLTSPTSQPHGLCQGGFPFLHPLPPPRLVSIQLTPILRPQVSGTVTDPPQHRAPVFHPEQRLLTAGNDVCVCVPSGAQCLLCDCMDAPKQGACSAHGSTLAPAQGSHDACLLIEYVSGGSKKSTCSLC